MDDPDKFPELMVHPMLSFIIVIESAALLSGQLVPAVFIFIQLEAGQHMDRRGDADTASVPLDTGAHRRLAVLRSDAHALKIPIVHGQYAGGIDPPHHVRRIMYFLRHAEKICHQTDVVDVQIHQRASGFVRIEDRQDLSLFKCIIPGRIL
jgi:hypothetical protein